jgi:chromosome segregation protein
VLKLKRVEVHGFKSFWERTEMRFNGAGITAVVGPNGCGKSNIGDAISWVLGEQSAKSLRGTRMEDVIFAGTRDRKPLGMAQVSLTMVDPAYHDEHSVNGAGAVNGVNGAAAAHDPGKPREITITRRLFRSGESEYLIDGKLARLRDIQDLFIGTGLGPESYAIIEQGRIGQILSSRPLDRRAVIEEAAGVGKFKARRRLAEAKLEGAKENLSRVFDILEEVGRQANSLKRQAAKARRYKELHEQLVAALRQSLAGRHRALERDAARVALDLNLASAAYQDQLRQTREKEKEHRDCQQSCYRVEAELTALRERLAGERLEAERTRGRLESQAREIAAIEERLAQGETESQSLEAQAAQTAGELAAQAGVLARIGEEVRESQEKLAAKTEARDLAQSDLRAEEQRMEAARREVMRLMEEAARVKNQLAQLDEYLAALDREKARAGREEEAAAADLERLGSLREQVSANLAARQMALESLGARRERLEGELNGRKAAEAGMRGDLDQLRQETANLKARRASLEQILSHRAYTTESVKRLFAAIEQGGAAGLRASGVLADFVEVDPAWEKAAEEFLHDELEYVVVGDWSQAESGIDVVRGEIEGRVTFLIHPEKGETLEGAAIPEPSLGPETGILGRLCDRLRMINGLTAAPAGLIPRLARCYLVDSRAAAQRLALQYPDHHFLMPDGVCYHGHAVSGGRKAGGGPLALKRELRELAGEVAARDRRIQEQSAALEAEQTAIAALSEELDAVRAMQQGEEKETLAVEHEARKLAEETARASGRISAARLELERLAAEAARSGAQREACGREVASLEERRVREESTLKAAGVRLEELRSRLSRMSEEHSALRVALAEGEERRRSEKAAEARLESRRDELLRRREEVAREMERLGVDRARLLADNIELDRQSTALAARISASEQAVGRLAEEEERGRASLAALEESLRELRAASQAAQERRGEIEVALAERRAEMRYLDETCRKELNLSLQDLAGETPEPPDEMALVEIEGRHADLKQRIENLGPVNPTALEEYQETQQRYEFLNAQRQDLLDSIRDTEKAIQDIDVETRKRFSEAFQAINANFREMFQRLFAGGTGEMRLTDESNLNESGIEIVASPPGKRLQSVLLLSGGEKALTALALLMAIFRYQPSPFCVLDEVDAPLDEPNIERLLHLLRDMAERTQFVLITHARRTMEVAESLYGVTMQEPGVSRLVSVRFTEPPTPTPDRSPAMAAMV